MNSILSRRSIRRYLSRPVAEEDIQELLQAAMAAPSAENEQPWHFVVIDDRQMLDSIPRIHPYSHMVREAPAAILVCGETKQDPSKGFWVQDCSAATENILLAAHAKGLGSVWLGIYPLEDRVLAFKEKFNLPDIITPLALLPIGYPAEQKDPANRYAAARVHKNVW